MKIFHFNADSATGKISQIPAISAEKNSVFPDIAFEQVFAGTVLYRKVFFMPEESKLFLAACLADNAPGYFLNRGTAEDSDPGNYTKWKGAGILQAAIEADTLTLAVRVDIAGQGFSELDLVRISDGVHQDFARVKAISWAEKTATLTLLPGARMNRAYAQGAVISACVERANVGMSSIWIQRRIIADAGYSRNASAEIMAIV